jgi:hypothetical protein
MVKEKQKEGKFQLTVTEENCVKEFPPKERKQINED